MRSKSLPREIAYWGSVTGLGFSLLERFALLIQASPGLRWLAHAWQGAVDAAATSALAQLHAWNLAPSPAHARLLPSLVELIAVVLLGFVYFGREPYWTRARRSRPNSALLPRYLFNLAACILLVAIILVSNSGIAINDPASLISAWNAVVGPSGILHSAIAIDFAITALFGASILVLVLWHPGTAIRVLFLMALIWLAGALIPVLANFAEPASK